MAPPIAENGKITKPCPKNECQTLRSDPKIFSRVFLCVILGFHRDKQYDGQPAFQRAHGTHFDYGKFAEAFPELDSLTKNFQDLPYDRLVLILENEAKRTTDRIEMFGAKIPADALALWGVPILILLQSYFLLHVAMFRQLLSTWGELPKVAWIGLYPTRASRIATLSSSVLLPLAIVTLLALKHGSNLSYWQLSLSVLGILASSLIGFLTIISLSRLTQTLATRT